MGLKKTTVTSPTLLVLAAGMGNRYGGLKQMDPVGPGGEVILEYSAFDAMRAGFGKFVFIIRKEMEQAFRENVGARFEKKIAVEYVFQELDNLPAGYSVPAGRTKPWGTTHAILMAADAVREPFAVINADDFYGAEGYRELAKHLTSGSPDYAMVAFTLRNTLSDFGSVARGVCRVSADGYLEQVTELTKIERAGNHARNVDAAGNVTELTGDEPVSMNIWGFTPAVFPQLKQQFGSFLTESGAEISAECYLPTSVNELILAGKAKVKALRSNGAWFGVTYRDDRARVAESIKRLVTAGEYPERLWQ